MKNITVSVDDDTYRRARIKAAEQDTSVSALVRRFLEGLAAEDSVAQREERELRERPRDFRGADRPPGDTSRQRGRWDDLFDRGPKVSDDFMRSKTQLQLMEELWESLSRDGAQLESPQWHEEAVDDAAARFEAGEEKPLDWAAAKRQLRKRAE